MICFYEPELKKRTGSLPAAVFHCDLLRMHGDRDWVEYLESAIYRSLGLTHQEQQEALSVLKSNGLIEERRTEPDGAIWHKIPKVGES